MTAYDAKGPVPLATPLRRLGGFAIDSVVYGLIVFVLLVGGGEDLETLARGEEVVSSSILLTGLLIFGVYQVSLTRLRGQTIGKMALRTKVIDADTGQLPGWQSSFIRWGAPGALTAVPWIGYLALVMYAWLLWDRRRQGLHDKAAQTMVIVVTS